MHKSRATDIENLRADLKHMGNVCKLKQTDKDANIMDRDLRARIETKVGDAEDK